MDIPTHKVFLSFFHNEDVYYRNQLIHDWSTSVRGFVDRSVGDEDIDDQGKTTEQVFQEIRNKYIADATVTIVLIGNGTWRRKYVDWEIGSSIRATKHNPRNGLIGILLPTYNNLNPNGLYNNIVNTNDNAGYYNPQTIPPRLFDNIKSGYAKIYCWPPSAHQFKQWIHDAFIRRNQQPDPANSRERFVNNRRETQNFWQ